MCNFLDISKSFIVLLEFNTKQWLVYSEDYDVYIEPPLDVLNKINKYSEENYIFQGNKFEEEMLTNEVLTNPSWLYETDYWWRGEL